jgi:7,8-dihydropterin-6-yl-methyl-4-(beta-D-ribofuranosyl)aminobenzene 5'-phosphate synthase
MRSYDDQIMNKNFNLTVVYDNNPFDPALQTDWGFSCFIRGAEKNILFDTGTNGNILLSNMSGLGIDPQDVEIVVLSHSHKDHTGGLSALLRENPDIAVYLPDFFPSPFKDSITKQGASYVNIKSYQKILTNVYSTGIISGWINEQGLILDSDKGIVLLTGCAHPRIVNIIETVKDTTKKEIYLVFGGFHLSGFDNQEIKEIIRSFKKLGVKKTGPSHCSGKEARELFSEFYGEDYMPIGVGTKISI